MRYLNCAQHFLGGMSMQFQATHTACIDGRTTGARNNILIQIALDQIAKAREMLHHRDSLRFDEIRIPGPVPLLASEDRERPRPEHDMASFVGYAKAVIDMHGVELHILSGHTACGMEHGQDAKNPLRCYEHLHAAMYQLQSLYDDAFADSIIDAEVQVAGMLLHVDDKRIIAIETFNLGDLEHLLDRIQRTDVDIRTHMAHVCVYQAKSVQQVDHYYNVMMANIHVDGISLNNPPVPECT